MQRMTLGFVQIQTGVPKRPPQRQRRAGLEVTVPKMRPSPDMPIAKWPEVISGAHSTPNDLTSEVWAPGNGRMNVRPMGLFCP